MFLLLILYIPKLNISTFKLCYKHHSDFSDMEMTIWLDFITKELTQASANVMTSVLLLLRQDFYHLLHHSHGNYAILIEREKQTTAILPASWPTCDLNEADPMAAFAVRPFVASRFVSGKSLCPSSSCVYVCVCMHACVSSVKLCNLPLIIFTNLCVWLMTSFSLRQPFPSCESFKVS